MSEIMYKLMQTCWEEISRFQDKNPSIYEQSQLPQRKHSFYQTLSVYWIPVDQIQNIYEYLTLFSLPNFLSK